MRFAEKKTKPKPPKPAGNSKCFAENKPMQGLHQPEPLAAAGRPNSPNTTEMLNGPIKALRPRQPPGDGHAHVAPPDLSTFGPCSGTHQPSTAAWPPLALSYIPAAALCALETAPDWFLKQFRGTFLRQVLTEQTAREEHRGEHRGRSCWNLKLRGCCKQTAQPRHPSFSQILLPIPQD